IKKEEDDEESNTDDDIKEFKELQTTIKNKLKPVDNIIDLESYEVAGYTASTSTVLSKVDSRHKVDWLLYAGKCPISFIDFKADEIERLDPRTSSENSLNTLNRIYKLIYDHLIFRTDKRPEFDQWLKSVKYYDVDNLYYGIILASFGKILTLPLNCPHCKKPFVKDVPTDDLVKYFNKVEMHCWNIFFKKWLKQLIKEDKNNLQKSIK
ncbi:MAG: hypothetical protein WCQ83_04810, partial [Endomicrobiia bacterium]